MYNELLKQHEEILKKLTEKASKETDFGERGQFINLQKMIEMEIRFIKNLNEIIEEYSDTKDTVENPTKQIEEVDTKKSDRYVYAYTANVGCMDLIYFDDFDGKDIINISDVRNTLKLIEVKEALFLANAIGYKIIVDGSTFGRMIIDKLKEIDDLIEIEDIRPTREVNMEAYCRYSKVKNSRKINTTNEVAKIALDAFEEVKTDVSQGYIKWYLERNDDRESLLKSILLAYHMIVELNK